MKKIILLVVAAFIIEACSTVAVTGRRQLNLVSDSEVIAASLTQYKEYMGSAKRSSNSNQTAMVTRVGKRIAAATEAYLKANGLESEIENFSWEFNLVQDDQINAFCMPGGKIVVYTGIMPLFSSDDELAVVLGHEVAHAVAKHSQERMSQELLTQYGAAIVGQALSTKSAAMQQLGTTVFGLGAQVGLTLPYSRKHESEADYMGLVFMTMAGYNPNTALTFWQKMAAAGSTSTPEVLSTHPSDATRISNIKKYLPEMEKYKPKK